MPSHDNRGCLGRSNCGATSRATTMVGAVGGAYTRAAAHVTLTRAAQRQRSIVVGYLYLLSNQSRNVLSTKRDRRKLRRCETRARKRGHYDRRYPPGGRSEEWGHGFVKLLHRVETRGGPGPRIPVE